MRSCFAVPAWPVGRRLWSRAGGDVRHRRRAESGEYGLRERPTIH